MGKILTVGDNVVISEKLNKCLRRQCIGTKSNGRGELQLKAMIALLQGMPNKWLRDDSYNSIAFRIAYEGHYNRICNNRGCWGKIGFCYDSNKYTLDVYESGICKYRYLDHNIIKNLISFGSEGNFAIVKGEFYPLKDPIPKKLRRVMLRYPIKEHVSF